VKTQFRLAASAAIIGSVLLIGLLWVADKASSSSARLTDQQRAAVQEALGKQEKAGEQAIRDWNVKHGAYVAQQTRIAKRRVAECNSRLDRARRLGVIYDIRGSRVLAGPVFYDMSIDAKRGLALTVNCVLSEGQENKCTDFAVVDYRDEKTLGYFTGCYYRSR